MTRLKRLVAAAAVVCACLAGTARADDGPVIGFTVGSSAGMPQQQIAPASATTPNVPGSVSVPVDFTSPPPVQQRLPLSALADLWHRAGAAYGIPWQVLAAIDKIESNFGENMGPSSAGAVGWMQFMPDTWLRWGVDADGNGLADPWNAADAIYAAARYLAASGGQTDISRAVFSYNHADWYVNEVLQLANVYGQGGTTETADLQRLQQALDAARTKVVGANHRFVAALMRERAMQRTLARMGAAAEHAQVLSDRLAAEHRLALYGARVARAYDATAGARSALDDARSKLDSVQQAARAPSFAPGAASVLAAPSYGNGYVFPVGGGPSIVSAAHTHHDYPAVDIAAPEGSPVYALANAVVENAWQTPDPRCGIGITIRAEDGQVWTYCHLSYLSPSVVTGTSLTAGEEVGLVGHTGDASGPHLHLQLQPPTAWPQQEAWFQSFAGRAFRWQDAPTPGLDSSSPAAAAPVFAVVDDAASSTIDFTR
jgi:murein DD-endopeptidase MepM/ murein hydrolase activator NlpD